MAKRGPRLTFHALTPEHWESFAELFGPRGACGGCWCMLWRCSRSQFEAQKGDGNRKAMHTLVKKGEEPGILAFDGGRAIGWCAIAPREDYPGLGRSRILKPVDATPVWSISCLFVARDYRHRGVSVVLLKASIEFVKERGGTTVEGYPVEPRKGEMPAAFAWTGLASAYLSAGFREHRRGSPTRPIMRFQIK